MVFFFMKIFELMINVRKWILDIDEDVILMFLMFRSWLMEILRIFLFFLIFVLLKVVVICGFLVFLGLLFGLMLILKFIVVGVKLLVKMKLIVVWSWLFWFFGLLFCDVIVEKIIGEMVVRSSVIIINFGIFIFIWGFCRLVKVI